MELLDYLKLANANKGAPNDGGKKKIKINLITNFTDEILQKILKGFLLSQGIYPEIFAVPYKQYYLHLKNRQSALYQNPADVTFILFDANPYLKSSFTSDEQHFLELLTDVKEYCLQTTAPVIMTSFLIPYLGAYGNLFELSPLFILIQQANQKLKDLSQEIKNLYIFDINALAQQQGERHIRDFRGLYAFDIPFNNDFLLALTQEWSSYIRALLGQTKKCIVLDLDNTLWGGVVGETGPLGIALGPDYPGLAYQNFQHALLDLYNRGIILAINSKNNPEDVSEVFAQNPHMILKENHFAAIRLNWEDKAKNMIEIAQEINIGLDSLVFIDDDPVNRGLVRSMLPDVAVPELPPAPEHYVPTLYSLNVFNQFSLTEEDWQKAKMYADERQRKNILYSTKNLKDYISALNIQIIVEKNNKAAIGRLSQLTIKTNQFNLTTKRYSEKEIEQLIDDGALIFSGNISDKFGDYGKTIIAVLKPINRDVIDLDTFLMSCRVMGRGVEQKFMHYLARELDRCGFGQLTAAFTPTQKNKPAKDFLSSLGFNQTNQDNETIHYSIGLPDLISNAQHLSQSVAIKEKSL